MGISGPIAGGAAESPLLTASDGDLAVAFFQRLVKDRLAVFLTANDDPKGPTVPN